MLELIDLDRAISKEEYNQQFPLLAQELGECQRLARAAGVPVIVVFEGWDAAGKGTIINRLTQALDPRGFKVHPDPRRPTKPSGCTPGCGGSGTSCRRRATGPFSTAPGIAACWKTASGEAVDKDQWPAGLRGHPPVRAAARRQRRGDRQVLAAHQQARTEEAVPAASRQPGHGLEGRQGRNAGSTGTTTSGWRPSRRCSYADQHGGRAVDGGRGHAAALRPSDGLSHAGRGNPRGAGRRSPACGRGGRA